MKTGIKTVPEWGRVGNGSWSCIVASKKLCLFCSRDSRPGCVCSCCMPQGFQGKKGLGETGVKCAMLTERTHCLYNVTASGSIWCISFGRCWILVAAGPSVTVTFDSPLTYGSLFSSQDVLWASHGRRTRHPCRWFSYPFISSPLAGVSLINHSISYNNIQQIECKKRRCFLTLACCFHNLLRALTGFFWPQNSSSSPLNGQRMHLCWWR